MKILPVVLSLLGALSSSSSWAFQAQPLTTLRRTTTAPITTVGRWMSQSAEARDRLEELASRWELLESQVKEFAKNPGQDRVCIDCVSCAVNYDDKKKKI